MKILLAILTTNGLSYLRRAINSAKKQKPGGVEYHIIVVANTLDDWYAQGVLALSAELGVEFIRTTCDGTHPTGVQSAYDLFLERKSYNFITQLDGDDWLYPTWALSVKDHLRRAPGLDAVWLVPIDQINGAESGVSWTTPKGSIASVWGTSVSMPWYMDPGAGPGRDPMWGHVTPTTPAMPRLVSRKAAEICSWIPAPRIYGDYQLLMRHLAAHIRGDLQCWVSMASDWMIIDRGNLSSVQHNEEYEINAYKMRKLARADVHPDRSWIGEFPIMYPSMQLTAMEKREWIDATEA